MSEGYSDMDEAAEDLSGQSDEINPWKEYFNSKKARGFVITWSVFLFAAAHLGYITTTGEAISFGAGAFAMFSAWAVDMKDDR